MWTDVVDLRDFYESSLGHVARRMIRRQLRELWPDVEKQRVLGLGYATPFLRPFMEQAERVIAAMPAGQGVLHWPREGPNRVVLVDEGDLPFSDLSMDRVLICHGLEHTEQLRAMLRESWRVLAGGGRLLAIVPNRRGVWSLVERTPFGFGRPYSLSQISSLLRDTMFTPERSATALYIPPSRRRIVLTSAPAWEKIGRRWFKAFSGVILIEASKQLYATNPERAVSRRRRVYMPVTEGAGKLRRARPSLPPIIVQGPR